MGPDHEEAEGGTWRRWCSYLDRATGPGPLRCAGLYPATEDLVEGDEVGERCSSECPRIIGGF